MAVNWRDYQVQGDRRKRGKNFDGTQLNSVYRFNVGDFLEMTVFLQMLYIVYCLYSLFILVTFMQ
jgi:hypothetical protein